MEIHFILLFMAVALFLFSIDKNNYKFAVFLLALAFLGSTFFLSAFRAETVGNDTIRYVDFFRSFFYVDDPWEIVSNTRFEPGYSLLNYIISRFSMDYTALLFVSASINLICTFYFYRSNCENKYSWCLLWFVSGLCYWSWSAVRASLAISFIYIFADDVLKGKKKQSLFWLFLATMFHYSSLVCSIILLLRSKILNRLLENKIILTVIFIFLAIFMNQIMSYIPESYSHYYFDSEYGEGPVRIASIVDFIFNVSFYILVAWKIPLIWNKQKEMQFLYFILVGISFLGLIFNPFNRIERFFVPFGIIYISNSFKYISYIRKIGVICLIVLLSAYQIVTFIVRPDWLQLFPYEFAF
ncbi:hypothetical protein Acfer_0571 [Acidaminococcus fermentans DSM 20731]|uniref:EpsG family protein n=2 Tax=Acidaminococcaceae TaxID=909930 RepID=D2RIR8_ACIFV|nr:EpsG family protein [Acidaminococcus fermentans]ADB46970.1 hypothetical protein Acfer_0571 [Acidaminococcus fermentans DSM 20731]